jgi:NitT/TauT family transport system ATP-binding protein
VLALDGIHLDVQPGEFVCLVGASGCGKSTLLNLVADLDEPTTGTREVSGKTGVMFQEAALFPWLTVAGNIELAQQLHGVKKAERRRRAQQLLNVVHLEGFAKKRPHELSGGMRQRVALARALAQDADVLLMDEPFGALDAMTRDLLHDELERLWSERNFTVLFVTHNVREAARLADRVVLLSSRPGRVAHIFENHLPRPRRIDDRPVSEMAGEITTRLREEVARHA